MGSFMQINVMQKGFRRNEKRDSLQDKTVGVVEMKET